jgi:hypothetical protein
MLTTLKKKGGKHTMIPMRTTIRPRWRRWKRRSCRARPRGGNHLSEDLIPSRRKMIRVVEPVRRDNLPAVVQDRGKHRSPNSRGGEVAVGRVE